MRQSIGFLKSEHKFTLLIDYDYRKFSLSVVPDQLSYSEVCGTVTHVVRYSGTSSTRATITNHQFKIPIGI